MRSAESISPLRTNNSRDEVGSGRGVSGVDCRGVDVSRRLDLDSGQSVFPVQADGEAVDGDNVADDSELCAPCDEEEQAEMPLCLPSVYQPTRSEYMDHCVTHYPFRAWCRH